MKVIKKIASKHDGGRMRAYVLMSCDCGEEFECRKDYSHKVTGCKACAFKDNGGKTHGMSRTRPFKIWAGILQRCTNKNNANYAQYQYFKPSTKWFSFEGFWEDMKDGYEDGLSIDRIDNSKPYSKENCRWVTQDVQTQNTKLLNTKNTSGYRGVSFNKHQQKWVSYIKVNDKRISLGSYNYAHTAAMAFDAYVLGNNTNHPTNFKVRTA